MIAGNTNKNKTMDPKVKALIEKTAKAKAKANPVATGKPVAIRTSLDAFDAAVEAAADRVPTAKQPCHGVGEGFNPDHIKDVCLKCGGTLPAGHTVMTAGCTKRGAMYQGTKSQCPTCGPIRRSDIGQMGLTQEARDFLDADAAFQEALNDEIHKLAGPKPPKKAKRAKRSKRSKRNRRPRRDMLCESKP